ncbi:MAG TPA: complex I NDUFA9 subunit family protein [Thiobacillaceae bacterium]|nr:complex I NDUFA9 subunit family protein [Thiobacillaceae bacterium]
MNIQTICVLGGSGFVGRALVSRLAARGKQVRVLSRKRERSKELILLPTVEVVEANIHDDRELVRHFHGADAVINLVGILHEEPQGKGNAQAARRGNFQQCHVELPRKIIQVCSEVGIDRLLHMSALGATPTSKSAYQRSKGGGEAIVRDADMRQQKSESGHPGDPQRPHHYGLDVTIFRPSVIFGRDDSFINMFAQLVRWFPVIPLANAHARFQPVWVEDVARAFVDSLEDLSSFGQTYELCGPKAYSLREIVEYAAHLQGRHTRIIPLNDRLSYLQAWAMEFKPGAKLMTRDNYYAMQQDNVCRGQWPFGFTPASLEAVVPAYLSRQSPRARYDAFRGHARRR